MIRARVDYRICGLIALAAIWAPSFVAQAEQPSPKSPPPAAESKAAPPPRAKPQVIYHLPRTSSYAATLHSQAKGQSTPLPIDNSAPPSPGSGPNEAVARPQQEQQQKQASPKINSSRQQRVKRPKLHSPQPQMRKQGPGKARGPGSSRGKSRKK